MKFLKFILFLAIAINCKAQRGGTIFNSTNVAPVYISQSTTLFAQFVSGGSETQNTRDKIQMNILMKVLVGLPIDAFWNFATNGTLGQYSRKVEWLHPGSYTATDHGSVTASSYKGILGGSSNANYEDMGYNPSTNSTNYTQNAGCNGVYVQSTPTGINGVAAGVISSSTDCQIFPRYTDGKTYAWTNISDATSPHFPSYTETVWPGVISAQMNSSIEAEIFKNGSSKGTTVIITAAIPNRNDYVLVGNYNGSNSNFFDGYVSFRFWAGKMTSSQHLTLANAMNNYLTYYITNAY